MKRKNCINQERALKYAKYFVENNSTVRGVAKQFGVSKTYVHYLFSNMTCAMYTSGNEKQLVLDVKALLEKNKSERHIRGGKATKEKYLNKRI